MAVTRSTEGITIVFEGDRVDFDSTADGVRKTLLTIGKITKQLNSEFKKTGSLDKFREKIEWMNEELKTAEDLVEAYRKELDAANKVPLGAEDRDKNIISAFNHLEDAKKKVADITAAIKKANKQLEEMESNAKKIDDAFIQTGETMKNFSSTVSTVGKILAPVSLATGKLLKDGLTEAVEYEQSIANLSRTLDSSGKSQEEFNAQLSELSDEIRELSERVPATATEIAETVALMAQLGVDDSNLMKFSEVMIGLGNTTNMSAEQAGESIAKLYNIMGEDMDTVDRFASTLLTLGVRAASTESEITEMAYRLAGAGNAIGMTEPEILALATALSDVGLEAQGGGSSISQIMRKIDKDVALNGTHLKDWAGLAGLTTKQFSQLWEDDVAGAFNKVIVGMGQTLDEGGNLNVLLDDLEISSIRQVDALQRLAGNETLLSKHLDTANAAWEENTALAEATAKIYDTLNSQWEITKNTLKNFLAEVVEQLMPVLKDMNSWLKNLLSWFRDLNPQTKKVLAIVGTALTVLSPLLLAIGGITSKLGDLLIKLGENGIGGKLAPLIRNFKGFGSVLQAFVNPVTVIVGLFALLMAKSQKLRDSVWELLKDVWETGLKPVFESIKTIVRSFITAIETKLDPLLTRLGDMIADYIIPVLSWFWDKLRILVIIFDQCAEWAGELLVDALLVLVAIIEEVANWVDNTIEAFSELWESMKETEAFQVIANGLDWLGDKIKTLWGWVTDLTNGFISLLNAAAQWLGVSGSVNSSIQSTNNRTNRAIAKDWSSGGFGSGGYNLSTSVTIQNYGSPVTSQMANQVVNLVNAKLGRMLKV